MTPYSSSDGRCACGLPLTPPPECRTWRPDLDEGPGPLVRAVTLYGRDPAENRIERVYDEPTPRDAPAVEAWWVKVVGVPGRAVSVMMPWWRVGLCPAETPHPVIALWCDQAGVWRAADMVRGSR